MLNNYRLSPTPFFKRKYRKLTTKNSILKEKIVATLKYLQVNPFLLNLQTHKVNSRIKSGVFSSRVTGDIRIIWEFSQEDIQVLDLLDIGGHDGGGGV